MQLEALKIKIIMLVSQYYFDILNNYHQVIHSYNQLPSKVITYLSLGYNKPPPALDCEMDARRMLKARVHLYPRFRINCINQNAQHCVQLTGSLHHQQVPQLSIVSQRLHAFSLHWVAGQDRIFELRNPPQQQFEPKWIVNSFRGIQLIRITK